MAAAAWHNRPQLDEFTRTFGIAGYHRDEPLLEHEPEDIVIIASPVAESAT